MAILKELWTQDIPDTEVKSTYQFVIDLRDRLESTCKMARENLEAAASKYKVYYDKKAKVRTLKVGDKAFVLLPTDNNKLLMQWKGPFTVVEKIGEADYRLDMNGKVKPYHANLLKRYVDRSRSVSESNTLPVVRTAVIDLENEHDDAEGELQELPVTTSYESIEQVDINPKLSDDERCQLRQLLIEFSDMLSDTPGCTHLLQHDIKLTTEVAIRLKPYPISFSMRDTVIDKVRKMIDMDIIESSESPFSLPIVIVKKKDHTNSFFLYKL